MTINDIYILIGYFVLTTASFQGLLGAIYKKFSFPKGSGWLKNYEGKYARIWGTIFFIGFAILPIVIFESIVLQINSKILIPVYILATLLSLYLALLSRKKGLFKIT